METWIFAFPVDRIYRKKRFDMSSHESKQKKQHNKTQPKKKTKRTIFGEN